MGKPTFQEPWNYYGLLRQQYMHIIAKGKEEGYLMKINGDVLLVVVNLAEAYIEMQFLARSDRQEFSSFGISYALLLLAIANATYVDILSRNYYSG